MVHNSILSLRMQSHIIKMVGFDHKAGGGARTSTLRYYSLLYSEIADSQNSLAEMSILPEGFLSYENSYLKIHCLFGGMITNVNKILWYY